jgi:hypothetical protein
MPNYVLDSNQALAHRLSHSANALKGAADILCDHCPALITEVNIVLALTECFLQIQSVEQRSADVSVRMFYSQ